MSTASAKAWRAKNPEKYSYNNLKNRAKQRGKSFTITFEYFLDFCRKYDYIQNKGKTALSYSVDCIINELGYVPGNIQAIPLGENSRKGTKILRYDWQTKNAFVENITREKTPVDFDEGVSNEGW